MVHLKESDDPRACIFGSLLEGDANKHNPQEEWVRIKAFKCSVIECTSFCVMKAKQFNQSCGSVFNLHGDIGDSMAGGRGILEPSSGYSGPGLRSGKASKPAKGGTHTSYFKLKAELGLCYFDNLETSQRKITLVKVKLDR